MNAPFQRDEVGECLRATLDLFLADHPELGGREVEIAENVETDGSFGFTIDGAVFQISVRDCGQ